VTRRPKVAFLLAGAGDGYEGLAAGLYQSEPVFRSLMDEGIEAAGPHLDRDIRLLSGLESGRSAAAGDLRSFIRSARLAAAAKPEPLSLPEQHCFDVLVAYALASFWRAMGVEPDGLLGYSLGEYAAAIVAGVFSLDDAMALVSGRARLIERLDQGGMLVVCLAPDAVAERLPDGVSIAAITAPMVCVVAGGAPQLDALQRELSEEAIAVRRLPSRAAIHTAHMQPVAPALGELVARTPRKAPTLRLISNLDGRAVDADAARDPERWMRHLTHPVQLTAGLRTLIEDGCRLFIEMGPGQALTGSALQMARGTRLTTASSLPAVGDPRSDRATFLTAVGRCWSAGLAPDWGVMEGRAVRTALPGRIWRNEAYSVGPLGALARAPAAEPVRDCAPGATPTGQVSGPPPAPPSFGSATEATVAELFADATGAGAVDRDSNFFELGGQSLLALQLLIRLQKVFGLELDPAMFYRNPTVEALSGYIDGLAAAQSPGLSRVPAPGEAI
jgi:acyl transferase domain-containing protein